ncbi:NRDE family protein [Burkholderia sp. Ax-1719]|uniref:NRDE family protein n=1 Tax=Burkholderia sp. Ax-1719 TaxID=2608334 RepID=UPI0014200965|nr:NRDE family protein [Burkholderia sp. Ax-1719]NIE68136.1 NRDE family protein [Burkholderia sp. Ax-1719]
MCLIVFDWRPRASDGALFTLAANRDEFLRRTAAPLQWWDDAPDVLAGRDLVGGGTWLGMTRGGRFAALTNYRAPHEMRPDAPTRGTLVSRWLTGAPDLPDTPLAYLDEVAREGDLYNGFNLVIGDWTRRELAWYCNRADKAPALLPDGTHGISNAVLDTPWPKLVHKRAELAQQVANGSDVPLDTLIEIMRDPRVAPDAQLPATGIPLERERALSAAFIDTPDYGTRGTTALRVRVNGEQLDVAVCERSDDDGSHRIKRPGGFERREHYTVSATISSF